MKDSKYSIDMKKRKEAFDMHAFCPNGKTCNYCLKNMGLCIDDIDIDYEVTV